MIKIVNESFLFRLQDTKTVIRKLPNVQEVIRLPWNHADLILGKDSDVLHKQIIESMNKYDET